MATYRKRGKRWNVQVRKQWHEPLSASFATKSEATAWAKQQEVIIEQGGVIDATGTTLADAIAQFKLSAILAPTRTTCWSGGVVIWATGS